MYSLSLVYFIFELSMQVNKNIKNSSPKTSFIDTVIRSLAELAISSSKNLLDNSLSNSFSQLSSVSIESENPSIALADLNKCNVIAVQDFQSQSVSLEQIEVLDQLYQENELGNTTCGFHAFKNGLVAIGLNSEFPGILPSWFKSKEVFEDIYHFLLQFQPQGDTDISIAPLTTALQALAFDEQSICVNYQDRSALSNLKIFQDVLKNNFHKITMFNYLDSDSAGLISESLFYLSNLDQFCRSLAPRDHVFIIGSHNHWMVFVVYKDQKGKLSWYVLNSYKNNIEQLRDNIKFLSRIISDSPSYIKNSYEEAVGEDLRRKAQWFNSDGNLKKEKYAATLFEQQSEYRNIIIHSFELMSKLGWLEKTTDEQIKMHIENLKILTKFYVQLESDSQLYNILTELEKSDN